MALEIHADRRLTAEVRGAELEWIASPERGVDRRMLERKGDEVALATSIVRYAPGSRFAAHVHGGGEEFLVLDGVFSDEEGDYPVGTYVRNPPGSRHAPCSEPGCVIFVKLRQMAALQTKRVRVYTHERRWRPVADRVHEAVLHEDHPIRVSLLRLDPGATFPARTVAGGEELFVVEGAIELHGAHSPLPRWGWRRSAEATQPAIATGVGALLWRQQGHL